MKLMRRRPVMGRNAVGLLVALLMALLIGNCPVFAQEDLSLVRLGEEKSERDGEFIYSVDRTKYNAKLWQTHLKGFIGRSNIAGLEIGCFEGRSTFWFLEKILTGPNSTMTCIDTFPPKVEQKFDHNVKVSGLGGRIKKIKAYSQDAMRKMDYGSFDFVYIDGCHRASCVMTDAVLAWDLLRPNGVIIFDDYSWNLVGYPPAERPKIAVDAFLESYMDQIRILHIGRQVIIAKLPKKRDEFMISHLHNMKKQRQKKRQLEAKRKAAGQQKP